MEIISHNSPEYAPGDGTTKYNGAYYYSTEIVNYFIPAIKTDRNWVTLNIPGKCLDHSIVFIHNNKRPEMYEWLSDFDDLLLVCGIPETCEKVAHLGTPIYLPLSVKVDYVERFRCEKDRGTAYAGRRVKRVSYILENVDFLENIPRDELLTQMAHYKNVYAVGRTAIEAKVLGCNVLPFDRRFPDPDIWQVIDTSEAIKILQKEIDEHDGHFG